MEVLDLFSAAAGGWSLGMHRAGFTTIAACEVEAWRRALYAENNPHVRLYDDVRTLTADRLLADLGRLPTIVVGSPPCQDISPANTKGKGVEGARSSLYFDAIRIIGECRPRWFALENSANLRTRGYDAVFAALEAIGYTCWPFVVRAGDVGANHERARAWVIGCDLAQVADADGVGRDERRSRRWGRFDLPAPADPRDAAQDGCGSGFPRRRAEPIERLSVQACGDAGDADSQCSPARIGAEAAKGSHDIGAGQFRPDAEHGGSGPLPASVGDFARAHQARQDDAAATCVRSQGQLGRDERREGEVAKRADLPSGRQVGLCSADRGDTDRGGPEWSLENLADHLRLDDGLSARLAGSRIALGDGKGQSAASLVVEAFGDAVIPQIPEAIGRAILRTEAALAAIYGAEARAA